jgi:hypothetical protein
MFKRTLYVVPALLLAIAFAFGALPAQVAHAQYPTFFSGIQIQNLSTNQANISISFLQEKATSETLSVSYEINPSAQLTLASLTAVEGLPGGFQGSAVISSDQKIAAIVNIVGTNFGGEAYVGVEGGANELALPFLNKAFFKQNTFFNVQNVGDAATNVAVTYRGRVGNDGPVQTFSDSYANLQPGASVRFDQAAAFLSNTSSSLPDGFNGSATISCPSSDCAAVVTLIGEKIAQVYNGFTAGATNPVFPLINVQPRFNTITGISLQNFGDTTTNVTVSYTPSQAGVACTETRTIEPKEIGYFAIGAFDSGHPFYDSNATNCVTVGGSTTPSFVGSASVTTNSANQPLVGIVNQNTASYAGTYTSFNPTQGTRTVVFPLIQDRWYSYFTGFSIVNVGDVATGITCTFSGNSVTQSPSEDLEPGEVWTIQQKDVMPANPANSRETYNGSGTCTATATNGKLVGIANQLGPSDQGGGVTRDNFNVYEAANNSR